MQDVRKNICTVLVAAILSSILLLYLFTYQVPANSVGVVFTLGKFQSLDREPGLKFKWPSPLQTVRLLDRRIRLFETKKQEALTRDKNNLIITVSTGWSIQDPEKFINSLKTVEDAQEKLLSRVESARNKALGEFNLHDLITQNNFNKQQKTFADFENRIFELLKADLFKPNVNWGIQINFVAVKQMIFPAEVSKKVFERMKAEREEESKRFRAEGDAEAQKIVSGAKAKARMLLAKAKAQADIKKGEADAVAAKNYVMLKKAPELAKYLREIKTLRKVMASGKVTSIFDASKQAPFTLLGKDAFQIRGKRSK